MTVQFLHTADLHLGSPLRAIGAESKEIRESLRESTYEAFTGIIDFAIDESVDFVVVAGDLYDQESRSVRANQFVVESDNATVMRYDGDAPLHLVMGFDGTVAMCGHDSDGPPPGMLETTDETVRTWARSYYVSARDDSTTITIESLGVDHHEAD